MSIALLELPELLDAIAVHLQFFPRDLISAACVCKIWSPVFVARIWRSIAYTQLSDLTFQAALPQHGQHVRSLAIIGSANLLPMLKNCPQLEAFDWTLAPNMDIHLLKRIVEGFPRLRRLTLNGCHGQSIAWIQILQNLEHLESLRFLDSFPQYVSYLAQQSIEAQEHLQSLEQGSGDDDEHELASESGDGDDVYHSQSNGSTETSSIPEYDFDPTYDPFDASSGDEDLEQLRFDFLGEFLVKRAPTLKELDLHGSSLRGIKLWAPTLESPPSLSSPQGDRPILALQRLCVAETCTRRPDDVVVPLLKQCPDLRSLDLSSNHDHSWDSFPWIILEEYNPRLSRLNLTQMGNIDNTVLCRIIRACAGLSSLLVSQTDIQDEVLDTLVELSTQGSGQRQPLLELDISWCSEISQAAVTRIVQSLATLKSLKMSWCANIESTIFQGKWLCTGLEEFEAQGLEDPTGRDQEQGAIGWYYDSMESEEDTDDEEEEDDEEEDDIYMTDSEEQCSGKEIDRALFGLLSSLSKVRRLAVGSSTTVISVAHGFKKLGEGRLGNLEELVLVGDCEYPLGLRELTVIAQFPRLCSFEFSLGLVGDMEQLTLAALRPHLRQEELEVYF
ncbi:hypothetical protein BG004_007547 [Podila humilis]|nr:hypothetical protein BG004_007547 [Podila humilis]